MGGAAGEGVLYGWQGYIFIIILVVQKEGRLNFGQRRRMGRKVVSLYIPPCFVLGRPAAVIAVFQILGDVGKSVGKGSAKCLAQFCRGCKDFSVYKFKGIAPISRHMQHIPRSLNHFALLLFRIDPAQYWLKYCRLGTVRRRRERESVNAPTVPRPFKRQAIGICGNA